MKALTIDALWAWAIVAGHKRVENRTWNTRHRGRLAIHAGRSRRSDGAAAALLAALGIAAPTGDELEGLRGAVLGTVELVDCVAYPQACDAARLVLGGSWDLAADPFATGPACWLLAAPRRLERPAVVKGQQGLWTLPAGIIE